MVRFGPSKVVHHPHLLTLHRLTSPLFSTTAPTVLFLLYILFFYLMAVTVPKLLSKLDLVLPFSKQSQNHRRAARTRSIRMAVNPPEDAPPPLPPKETLVKPHNPHRETWAAIYTAYNLSLAFQDSDSPSSSTSSSPVSGAKVNLDHDNSAQAIYLSRQIRYPSPSPYTPTDTMSYPLPRPPRQYAPVSPPQHGKVHSPRPKPAASPSTPPRRAPLSPEEAEHKRREALRIKALEEAQALREEAERQLRLKEEKRAVMLRHFEEEMRRKAALEDQLRRIGEEKRRKELEEEEEEARREEERMLRKRRERERRQEETRRAEEWRDAIRKSQEEEWVRKEQARRGVVEQRKKLAIHLKEASKTHEGKAVLLSGWITVQVEGSVAWKRRYFRLTEDQLVLFKTASVSSL